VINLFATYYGVYTFLAAENISKEELEVLREMISKMEADT